MRPFYLFLTVVLFSSLASAQTIEELKALKEQKQDSIKLLEDEVKYLTEQIDNVKGWQIGALLTGGISISQFDNWYAQESPNVNSGKIGFNFNGFANLDREAYFWKNAMNVNIQWVKFDDKNDPNDNEGFREATDVFNVNSLFGYKLSEKFALSAMAEYRSTLLSNFNDPGYLDLGAGVTWSAIKDELTIVVHPLNYNFVFSSSDDIFNSSAGAKVMADYFKKWGNLKVKSNYTGFFSYESSNFSNWTWTNTLAYTLWKNIGLGFEFGLRDNKQEALNYAINTLGIPDADFDNVANDLQSYWLLGINFSI